MNIVELFELSSWSDRLNELKSYSSERTKDAYLKYYKGNHSILTDPERADVNITLYEEKDGKKTATGARTIKKTRKILNYARQLIGILASFVFGNPPDLILNTNNPTAAETEAFQKLKDVWIKEARLNEHNKSLLRAVSVETCAAELLFNNNPESPKEGKVKVLLLSKENGDEFYPFFNDSRDMEAFTRIYMKRTVIDGKLKEKYYTEIWTAERFILLDTTSGIPTVPEKDEINPYGKIPIIFYDQKETEWAIVENLIDIIERKESQLSDVNTRVGHAAVKVTGKLVNMPDATQDVKVYQIEPIVGSDGKTTAGDVSYLESQTAPESVKLELDRTEESIYRFTNIPNLYEIFKNSMNESGKALKIRLFPMNIIIDEKREIYGIGLDRRLNLLKTMLASITGSQVFEDLDVSVQFRAYIPEDLATTLDELMTANGNKPVLSQERSVAMNPMVKDATAEMTKIKEEESAVVAGTFNP